MTNSSSARYELGASEYDAATSRFFSAGVEALMQATGGLYSLVSKSKEEFVTDHSTQLPDGSAVNMQPIEVLLEFSMDVPEIIDGGFDSFMGAMNKVAADQVEQITKAIFANMNEVAEAVGNVIRRPIGHDVLIDAIESMDVSFDEEGRHNLNLVVHPDTARKLNELGEPTPEQAARLDSVLARKKQEQEDALEQKRNEIDARRRNRQLPPRRK